MSTRQCLPKTNSFVSPLLTDMYQVTMSYAYWKSKRHMDQAVFDLFFRKHPFGGEFTIFAGLEECLKFIEGYSISANEIEALKKRLDHCDPEFFDWLATMNMRSIKVYAIPEGTVVHPRVPLMRIEGPLALCQLLETTLLNLVNYATLMATNAARFRLAAGKDKSLIEFGLRRAQGPDGAMSASRYSYVGGFDGTSNVLAALVHDLPCRGTHAHSFVTSYSSLSDLNTEILNDADGTPHNLVELTQKYRKMFGFTLTNEGELAAFIAYAQAFPSGFLALVDTYDTLNSGVPNFLCVGAALMEIGYTPVGIRLDSGDLAFLSRESRKLFVKFGAIVSREEAFKKFAIMASNDITEKVLHSLADEGHEIDVFGIGTNLVTCLLQPALGAVYKLVEINEQPRIKLSNQFVKITLPGCKDAFRLFSSSGLAILDLMQTTKEDPPKPGERLLCRHPFDEVRRAYVTPDRVVPLHDLVYDQGKLTRPHPHIEEVRDQVAKSMATLRSDMLRSTNPAAYKVSVTPILYNFLHNTWLEESPIIEIFE